MSTEEQAELLASDGMLVKRPILLANGHVCVGFKGSDWEKALEI
jgi:arsenate reductase